MQGRPQHRCRAVTGGLADLGEEPAGLVLVAAARRRLREVRDHPAAVPVMIGRVPVSEDPAQVPPGVVIPGRAQVAQAAGGLDNREPVPRVDWRELAFSVPGELAGGGFVPAQRGQHEPRALADRDEQRLAGLPGDLHGLRRG